MNFRVIGTGEAVLFLHGIPTNGHLWDIVAAKISTKHKCILVDLPGMGNSPPLKSNSLDPDEYAQELDALRQQLSISSWHVVGHDAGATIAVHYVSRFSSHMKSLTLCSPPIYPELKIPPFFRLLRGRISGYFLGSIVKFIVFNAALPLIIKPRDEATKTIVKSFYQSYKGSIGTKRFLTILRWGDPQKILAKTAKLLNGITAPTLILHGKKDNTIPESFALRAARTIENSELHLLNGSHFTPIICPDEFCEYLIPFLEVYSSD